MQRLRQRWVALLGGALLVTLTVSTVFGADPADAPDDPRGRTIAAFVHSLIFGEQDAPSDEPQDEEETLEDEELEEDGTAEGTEVDGAAHGACVSEVARDKDAVGGPNDNHGGAVSEAARETCWDEPDPGEELTDPELDDEVPLEEEAADAHGTCVSEVARDRDATGGPNDNHGGAVSEAARETCREAPDAGAAEVESGEAQGGGNGKGRGSGRGGRP